MTPLRQKEVEWGGVKGRAVETIPSACTLKGQYPLPSVATRAIFKAEQLGFCPKTLKFGRCKNPTLTQLKILSAFFCAACPERPNC